MAKQFDQLNDEHRQFIENQKVFFVGSADRSGRVNVSPKGQDSLRVLGGNQILWANLTGSGNETAAHLLECNRITLMWCAFQGPPMILRVYGTAAVFHPRDTRYTELAAVLPETVGTRQYIIVDFDLVQTSCGYGVPMMDFVEERTALTQWSEKKGREGVEAYWRDRNMLSIDGKPTKVFE